MSVVSQSNMLKVGATCMLLALLAACAQSEVKQTGEGSPAPQIVQSNASTRVEKPVEQITAEAELDYQNMNPVPIAFEKLGVKLNDTGRHVIGKIGNRAKKSKKLVIVGYCDRKQVGNAHAAALARANAVKSELVHLGVKPRSIQLKTVTNAADKHLAEIQFS